MPTVSPPIAAISRARPSPGATRGPSAPSGATTRRSISCSPIGESSARSRDLGRDLARGLRVIGVHLEMTGERAQCVLQLVVRARRHGKTPRDQLRGPPLRGREPDHAQPLRRVAHDA